MKTSTEIRNLPVYAEHPELNQREWICLMHIWTDFLCDRIDAIDYALNASNLYTMALLRDESSELPCKDAVRECFRDRLYIDDTRDTFRQWRKRSLSVSEQDSPEVYKARLRLLDEAISLADSLLSRENDRFDDGDTMLLHCYYYALNIFPCRPYVD